MSIDTRSSPCRSWRGENSCATAMSGALSRSPPCSAAIVVVSRRSIEARKHVPGLVTILPGAAGAHDARVEVQSFERDACPHRESRATS